VSCASQYLARYGWKPGNPPYSSAGRQLRLLLILLALEAGRVVPAAVLAAGRWPEEEPADPGNALQTLVSRLRAALRPAGLDPLIESHPAGYRLAEARSQAAQDRIEAELELGEAAALTGELRALVADDPLAERPRALLMRALPPRAVRRRPWPYSPRAATRWPTVSA
jgi:DNA-binding SARP family transcriptional activator